MRRAGHCESKRTLNLSAAFLACLAGMLLDSVSAQGQLQPNRTATPFTQEQRAQFDNAVAYCRGIKAEVLHLSQDGNTFCFNGKIEDQTQITAIEAMNDGALFVIRSPGGAIRKGIQIGAVLATKNAIVVAYDYCMSACAGIILPAPTHAYIARDTVLAWHSTILPNGKLADFGYLKSHKFFRSRMKEPIASLPPRSKYIQQWEKIMREGRGYESYLVWTLNSRSLRQIYKTHIEFANEPTSEEQFDELVKRYRFGKILFDP